MKVKRKVYDKIILKQTDKNFKLWVGIPNHRVKPESTYTIFFRNLNKHNSN